MAYLNLARPIRSERRRGFQPPYYTVFVYLCSECGRETVVRSSSFRGLRRTSSGGLVPIHAVPDIGAIRCSCDSRNGEEN